MSQQYFRGRDPFSTQARLQSQFILSASQHPGTWPGTRLGRIPHISTCQSGVQIGGCGVRRGLQVTFGGGRGVGAAFGGDVG